MYFEGGGEGLARIDYTGVSQYFPSFISGSYFISI